MDPHRISIKFPVENPADVDLEAAIPAFHGWIQRQLTDVLLIDVADYKHVPDGPGVILVGHEGDFAIDMAPPGPGFMYTGKREWTGGFRDKIRDVLRHALIGCKQVEEEGKLGLTFRTDEVRLAILDRLEAPNAAESFEAARAEIEPVFREVYEGVDVKVDHADADPKKPLALRITAPNAPDAATLLDRLEVQV